MDPKPGANWILTLLGGMMISRLGKALFCLTGLIYLPGCEQSTNGGNTGYPAPQSAAAQTYMRYCGECHVPPQPARYRFSAWSPVMERMQLHRRSRGMDAIPNDDRALILDYLQQYAAH